MDMMTKDRKFDLLCRVYEQLTDEKRKKVLRLAEQLLSAQAAIGKVKGRR
jgi:hypothetical protein